MNVYELWDQYRADKLLSCEHLLEERGKQDSVFRGNFWLETVEPPEWFISEVLETLNTSGLSPVCVHERR